MIPRSSEGVTCTCTAPSRVRFFFEAKDERKEIFPPYTEIKEVMMKISHSPWCPKDGPRTWDSKNFAAAGGGKMAPGWVFRENCYPQTWCEGLTSWVTWHTSHCFEMLQHVFSSAHLVNLPGFLHSSKVGCQWWYLYRYQLILTFETSLIKMGL